MMSEREKEYIADNLTSREILNLYDKFLERYEKVSDDYTKIKQKYNNLCDKLSYEQGWDPREDK